MVVAGRDAGKLDLVAAAVAENLNVVIEPPWVLDPADLPRLEAVLWPQSREVLVKELTPARHAPAPRVAARVLRDAAASGAPGSAPRPTRR